MPFADIGKVTSAQLVLIYSITIDKLSPGRTMLVGQGPLDELMPRGEGASFGRTAAAQPVPGRSGDMSPACRDQVWRHAATVYARFPIRLCPLKPLICTRAATRDIARRDRGQARALRWTSRHPRMAIPGLAIRGLVFVEARKWLRNVARPQYGTRG